MAEKNHPYENLRVSLANLIAQAAPGEKLPTEPLLARQMGVSRATLREAMRSFESQGLIRRRQGIGTFVVGRSQVIDTGLEVLESIETLADRIGLEVSMDDLWVHIIQADEEISSALDVSTSEEVIKVSRTIRAENRPVAYLVDILVKDTLPLEEIS